MCLFMDNRRCSYTTATRLGHGEVQERVGDGPSLITIVFEGPWRARAMATWRCYPSSERPGFLRATGTYETPTSGLGSGRDGNTEPEKMGAARGCVRNDSESWLLVRLTCLHTPNHSEASKVYVRCDMYMVVH